MKYIRQKIKEQGQKTFRLSLLLAPLSLLLFGCNKVEYTQIEDPAYLRVFNNLNYKLTAQEKGEKIPFLCMILNPTFDADGKVTGGEIVGDYLDVRAPYAPPYPVHVGTSTDPYNPEYPGKKNVLVGPMLNGYDLSSWAQVPAGEVRVLFLYRPKSFVPYFDLEPHLRDDVLLDTTLSLQSKEVYTLHLLQKDFATKENGVVLRQESFHKQPFSDSLVYVNFYNYSADGFWQADNELKDYEERTGNFGQGIQDVMDVYLTLYQNENDQQDTAIVGFKEQYLTTLIRDNQSGRVNPYLSFPLWANPKDNKIVTHAFQHLAFITPVLTPIDIYVFNNSTVNGGVYASLDCWGMGTRSKTVQRAACLPNMLVNIHSGSYNPRTFATINTLEIVNGSVYLTTIQRKYEPPIY